MAKKRSNEEISASLLEELREFKAEKEEIRSVVGQIGGKASNRAEAIINIVFVLAVLGLFVFDVVRHIYHVAEDRSFPVLDSQLHRVSYQ